MLIRSRREFFRDAIRSVSAVGAMGAMAKLGEMNALALGGSGYQALVCIFMAGGNDGHNTVIPITTAQQNYGVYSGARSFLALPQASLSVINNGNDVYGLHPRLTEIQGLYNSGKAAVVANMGMLVKHTTKADFNSNNSSILPAALFSHSDQSSQWQSSVPTGLGSSGWGGRLADAVQPMNSGALFPSVTSLNGSSLFCDGIQTLPATVPPGGSAQLLNSDQARAAGMQQLLTFTNGMQLVQAANNTTARGVAYANTLNTLLAGSTVQTVFPAGNPLAQQLQTVARMMKVQSQLGLSRQIFFCQLGGFDTHGGQLGIQDTLLQQLSQAVGAFYQATQELGLDQQVTTFTASEFGRTLVPNSSGTDHAWGNHHFVIGGSVKGGQFFGQFPSLAPGGQDDANTRGTLIPTTSVDQYGATLASWFGVSAANMSTVFPNIGNFAAQKLGVLG